MTQAETVFRLQGNYSSDELAKHTKAMIKAKGIESPDVTQMFSIKRGKSMYYYNTKEKYEKALERFAEEDKPVVKEAPKQNSTKPSKDKKTTDPIYCCGNCQLKELREGKWSNTWINCVNGHRKNKRVYRNTEACSFFKPIKKRK